MQSLAALVLMIESKASGYEMEDAIAHLLFFYQSSLYQGFHLLTRKLETIRQVM